MRSEKRKRLATEYQELGSQMIINGLVLHPDAEKEKRPEANEETRLSVTNLLSSIGIKEDVNGIEKSVRLPSKEIKLKDGTNGKTSTIKVFFKSVESKVQVYRALAAQGSQIRNVQFHDVVPRDLLPKKRNLETIASRWRAEHKEVRTRAICKNGNIILMAKKNSEKKYTRVPQEIIDSELDGLREQKAEERKNKIKEKNPLTTGPQTKRSRNDIDDIISILQSQKSA